MAMLAPGTAVGGSEPLASAPTRKAILKPTTPTLPTLSPTPTLAPAPTTLAPPTGGPGTPAPPQLTPTAAPTIQPVSSPQPVLQAAPTPAPAKTPTAPRPVTTTVAPTQPVSQPAPTSQPVAAPMPVSYAAPAAPTAPTAPATTTINPVMPVLKAAPTLAPVPAPLPINPKSATTAGDLTPEEIARRAAGVTQPTLAPTSTTQSLPGGPVITPSLPKPVAPMAAPQLPIPALPTMPQTGSVPINVPPPVLQPGTGAIPVAPNMPVLKPAVPATTPTPASPISMTPDMPVLKPGMNLPGAPSAPTGPNMPTLGGNPLVPAGQNRVPMADFGALLEKFLASPTRFDTQAFKDSYEFGKKDLQNEAERSKQAVLADAARRGVFYSTLPDTQQGGVFDINERFNRGLGQLSSNLMLEQARTGSQDFNNALGNMFRFLENQQGADQFAARLGLDSANLGFQGSPDINSILALLSGQAGPQMPGGPSGLEQLAAALGQYYGSKPKQPTTTQGTPVTAVPNA